MVQFLIDIALTLIYFFGFLLLCAWSWRFWTMYVQQKFLNKLNEDFVMIEIKLPREIKKSPFASEVAIASLLQGGGVGNWYDRLFKGNLPFYASLEIASIEGVIHFYVRVQKKFRPLVESNFYAQYPGIEIVEAEDYTKLIHYHHLLKTVDIWGAAFKLKATWVPKNEKTGKKLEKNGEDYKMPADFLLIKTYNDYALNDPDKENQIDPLTPLLEIMGTMKKGEHFWYQIILQDEGVYDNKKFPKFYLNEVTHEHWSLSDMIEKFKKQVRWGNVIEKGTVVEDEYGYVRKDDEGKPKTYQKDVIPTKKETELTAEEKWQIDEANKKQSKPLAICVVRSLYVVDTTKAAFNADNIQNVLSFLKPYAGANAFFPKTLATPYNYDWQNYRGRRNPWRKEELFEAYVEREGFYPHITSREWLDKNEDQWFWTSSMKTRKTWRMLYEGLFHPFSHPHPEEAFTLNLEEVASLWHLPGANATTPSLPRIDSAKGVAPVNIPQ